MSTSAELVPRGGQKGSQPLRELNHRITGDNLYDISLLWDPNNGAVHLHIVTFDEVYELEVPQDKAKDAFEHPLAYALGGRIVTEAALNYPPQAA